MDNLEIALEILKDTRIAAREIQARIYNLSTTLVGFSFLISSFTIEKIKDALVSVVLFSDVGIVVLLITLYWRILSDYGLTRRAVEKGQSVIIRMIDGEAVTSEEIVAPHLRMTANPRLSVPREANLFLWAAAIVILKALFLLAIRNKLIVHV